MSDNQMIANDVMIKQSNIERTIQEKGKVVTVPLGKSMWPMLKNRRDHIVIVPVKRSFRKYDVPLYKRNKNTFVLHRIIKVHSDGRYVICGDNLWRKEYNVHDEDIVGILAGFFKGDRYIDCENNKLYHAYVIVWRALYPIRSCILIAREHGSRIKCKIKGRKLNG